MMKRTVLFADDELHNIEGLIETVRAEGCDIKTCRDATTAVRLVKQGGIDCLVIDIMMNPGPDFPHNDPQSAGLAAIAEILSVLPHQPIVCFSVIGDQKVINMLKQKGVLYLRKAETSANKAWRVIESKMTGIYRLG